MHNGSKAALAMAIAVLVGTPGVSSATMTSDFTLGDDGWTVVNWDGSGAPVVPEWFGGGGNPGGYIAAVDVHGDGFFKAPAKFLGDLSALYGGSVSYDAFTEYSGWSMSDIFIQNSALKGGDPAAVDTISYRFPGNPAGAWTQFNAPVVASSTGGWMWGLFYDGLGSSATEQQIKSVLANVTDIRIRQEYAFGSDWSGLDNVSISASPVPVPGALLLFAPSVIGLAAARRRGATRA